MRETKPASKMTDSQIAIELKKLEREWDDLRDDLEESGGMSGSPGEWLYERMNELETEQKRRQLR
jgi:hypothetical protein